jgi:hypothetical protein
MTFLKADKFGSLTVKPHEYDKYFRCVSQVTTCNSDVPSQCHSFTMQITTVSDRFHRRLPGAYDNVYYVSDGEKEDLLVPTIAATTIMVLPLLLVGLKVLQKAL